MIKDVESLESYLAANSARLGIEGQAMGRALYLSRKAALGALNLPEIERVLEEFHLTEIKSHDWFCGMVEGIYAGMVRPDDIRNIIHQAMK